MGRVALTVSLALLTLPCSGVLAPASADEESDFVKVLNERYPLDFRVKVNDALRRGTAWLLSAQRPDGSWSFMNYHRGYPMGPTALATLTLLKCGVKPDHEAVQKAFAYLGKLEMRRTYAVGALLMALDAKYVPARDPFDDDADKYDLGAGRDDCARKITADDKAWMERGVAFLTEAQTGDGVWRYPSGGEYDLSCTQFALLGLHAATRCGVTVKNEVWLDALEFLLAQQETTGPPIFYRANEVRGRYRFEWIERSLARGFRYRHGARVNGSMTTAGLCSLIICQNRMWRSRAFTGKLRVDTRRGIRDAMAWLQHHFAVVHNPYGAKEWHWYYLYGLERSGILGRFRNLGDHDWYKEGADFLTSKQDKKGMFHSGQFWEDNCFALLFLKRATSRMDAPAITPSTSEPPKERKPKTGQGAPVAKPGDELDHEAALKYWIKKLRSNDANDVFRATLKLDRLGDLRSVRPLIATMRTHTAPYARVGAVVALQHLRAVDAMPSLIDALGDKDDLVRHAVNLALLRISGQHPKSFPFHAGLKGSDRLKLQKAWRAWFEQHEAALRTKYKQPK